MDPQAQKQGIIHWKSTVTGKAGRGQPLPLDEARRLARQLNLQHPLVAHIVEELQ
jgi:hypothetical protein